MPRMATEAAASAMVHSSGRDEEKIADVEKSMVGVARSECSLSVSELPEHSICLL